MNQGALRNLASVPVLASRRRSCQLLELL
jgi:hypothetical protein